MADLYVCPVCHQVEDCACERFAEACVSLGAAKSKVRERLGAVVVTILRGLKTETDPDASKNAVSACLRHIEKADAALGHDS